jgi:hypothetical protein
MTLILSGTDGLSDVDGSAATPAIRGTDANTGIFFPAADTIAFSEGGVESMRIDSAGLVGIGITPYYGHRLAVNGSTVTQNLFLNASAGGDQTGFFNDGGTSSTSAALSVRNSGGGNLLIAQYGGNLQFNSGYGSAATAYGCRAWVTFNGTGTPAIRASGNISSIVDYGTGDYGILFSTSMPDTNYSLVGAAVKTGGGPSGTNSAVVTMGESPSTAGTGVGVLTVDGTSVDRAYVYAAFFR